jgi:hypothetical protein
MSSCDVRELNDCLSIPSLKKILLTIPCMVNLQYRVALEGKQRTINDCSIESLRTLARGVQDGDLYKLLVDPMHLHMIMGS